MRGVESRGMLCSTKELGIDDDASGLLVLDAGSTPGTDVREALAKQGMTDFRFLPGDGVFFRTGWGVHWIKDNAKFNGGEPGKSLFPLLACRDGKWVRCSRM